jgi:hypothetical protein
MNERIRELERQATDYYSNGQERIFDRQKFAQLIVRECAGRVDYILRERQAGGGTMGDDIREHFGVEE